MFHIIFITGVLTAMNDYIHCHRLLLSHFITTTKILAAVTLGFHLCQFNIGRFDDVTLNFVVFVIVSVFYSWTGCVIVAFLG